MYERALNWLLKQPSINIYASGVGGFGEEKNNINIYFWLRSIGYEQTISIIYNENHVNDIVNLLGLAHDAPLGDIFEFSSSPVTKLISFNYFKQHQHEFEFGNLALGGLTIDWPAESLKSKFFIINTAQLIKNQLGFNVYGESAYRFINTPEPKIGGLPYKFSSETAIQQLLTEQNTNQYQTIEILLNLPREQRSLISIYGLNVVFREHIKPENIISNLTPAWRLVQQQTNIFSPTFLLLFNELSKDDLLALQALPGRFPQLHYLDAQECDTAEKLSQFEQDDIVILYIGSLPATIFDFVVSQSSLYIAEGLSAQALSLASPTPLTFLHTGYLSQQLELKAHYAFETRAEQLNSAVFEQMVQARQALANVDAIIPGKDNARIIAEYILDSYNINSSLYAVFDQLRQEFKTNNAILSTLTFILENNIEPNFLPHTDYVQLANTIKENDESAFQQLILYINPSQYSSAGELSLLQQAMENGNYRYLSLAAEKINSDNCFYPHPGTTITIKMEDNQLIWPFPLLSYARAWNLYQTSEVVSLQALEAGIVFNATSSEIDYIYEVLKEDISLPDYSKLLRLAILTKNNYALSKILSVYTLTDNDIVFSAAHANLDYFKELLIRYHLTHKPRAFIYSKMVREILHSGNDTIERNARIKQISEYYHHKYDLSSIEIPSPNPFEAQTLVTDILYFTHTEADKQRLAENLNPSLCKILLDGIGAKNVIVKAILLNWDDVGIKALNELCHVPGDELQKFTSKLPCPTTEKLPSSNIKSIAALVGSSGFFLSKGTSTTVSSDYPSVMTVLPEYVMLGLLLSAGFILLLIYITMKHFSKPVEDSELKLKTP